MMSPIAKIINIPRLASKYVPQHKTVLQDKPKSRNGNTVQSAISCKTFRINPISKGNREPFIHEDKLLTFSNRQRTPNVFNNNNNTHQDIIYQFNTHQLSGHKMLSVPLRHTTKKKISYKNSYKLLTFINDFNHLISSNACKEYLSGNAVNASDMNGLMKVLHEFQGKMNSVQIKENDDLVKEHDSCVNNEVKSESDKRPQFGPVVQSVSTPACHAGGRRFESVPGRHINASEQSFRLCSICLCSSVGRAVD